MLRTKNNTGTDSYSLQIALHTLFILFTVLHQGEGRGREGILCLQYVHAGVYVYYLSDTMQGPYTELKVRRLFFLKSVPEVQFLDGIEQTIVADGIRLDDW